MRHLTSLLPPWLAKKTTQVDYNNKTHNTRKNENIKYEKEKPDMLRMLIAQLKVRDKPRIQSQINVKEKGQVAEKNKTWTLLTQLIRQSILYKRRERPREGKRGPAVRGKKLITPSPLSLSLFLATHKGDNVNSWYECWKMAILGVLNMSALALVCGAYCIAYSWDLCSVRLIWGVGVALGIQTERVYVCVVQCSMNVCLSYEADVCGVHRMWYCIYIRYSALHVHVWAS